MNEDIETWPENPDLTARTRLLGALEKIDGLDNLSFYIQNLPEGELQIADKMLLAEDPHHEHGIDILAWASPDYEQQKRIIELVSRIKDLRNEEAIRRDSARELIDMLPQRPATLPSFE